MQSQPKPKFRKVLIGTGLIGAIALALFFFRDRATDAPASAPEPAAPVRVTLAPEEKRVQEEMGSVAPPAPGAAQDSAAAAQNSGASSALPPLEPPSRERFREEVAQNPHSTPPVMIEFSGRMAAAMERALANESEAGKFFDELEDCVRAQEAHMLPVRAVCLVNAARLGKKWERSLGTRQERLQKQASPELIRLVEATGVN